MRPLWPALGVLAVVAVTAFVLTLEGPESPPEDPDDPTWHVAGATSGTDRFCGDCHYGLQEMWESTWTRADRNWTLTVAPAYAEAPLLALQLAADESELVLAGGDWSSFDWRVGEPQAFTVSVPDDATAFFVRLHGSGPPDDADALGLAAMRVNQAVTSLRLVAPDGTAYDADGPQEDLRVLTVPAQPGDWTVEAELVGGDAPAGTGWLLWEALGGDVVPAVEKRSEAAMWTFLGNETGAPPSVWLRVRPHHDHAPYEHTDWDAYDVSPFTTRFEPALGPAPTPLLPRDWNATAVDALWDGAESRVVVERSGAFTGAYVDEEGHNDPGVGGSYPAFGPLGDPVWPGTARAVFEMTWTPPVDLPGLGVRFSPAHTPYFFEAEPVERAAGSATFAVAVQPEWWEAPDQVLAWLDPDAVTSYWDIAPYLDGDVQAGSVQWALRVTTERGATA